MAGSRPCSPVSRRKRRVQRQIDHVSLGAVTRARVVLAPWCSDADDVLAADGPGVDDQRPRGTSGLHGVKEDGAVQGLVRSDLAYRLSVDNVPGGVSGW